MVTVEIYIFISVMSYDVIGVNACYIRSVGACDGIKIFLLIRNAVLTIKPVREGYSAVGGNQKVIDFYAVAKGAFELGDGR